MKKLEEVQTTDLDAVAGGCKRCRCVNQNQNGNNDQMMLMMMLLMQQQNANNTTSRRRR